MLYCKIVLQTNFYVAIDRQGGTWNRILIKFVSLKWILSERGLVLLFSIFDLILNKESTISSSYHVLKDTPCEIHKLGACV